MYSQLVRPAEQYGICTVVSAVSPGCNQSFYPGSVSWIRILEPDFKILDLVLDLEDIILKDSEAKAFLYYS